MRLLHFFLLFFLCLNLACKPKDPGNTGKETGFSRITFYSSRCNGTCPDITLSIDEQKTIKFKRQVYTSKSDIDSSLSGAFKGELAQADFDKLVTLVKEINWDGIEWPVVTCCDRPVKTVIVHVNGSTKRFKSMDWPEEADKLIRFLTSLGTGIQLPEYTDPMDFETMKE